MIDVIEHEDVWHDYRKEKPNRDDEGEDFLVTNDGHSYWVSTLCEGGRFEQEVFGSSLCNEITHWKSFKKLEANK